MAAGLSNDAVPPATIQKVVNETREEKSRASNTGRHAHVKACSIGFEGMVSVAPIGASELQQQPHDEAAHTSFSCSITCGMHKACFRRPQVLMCRNSTA